MSGTLSGSLLTVALLFGWAETVASHPSFSYEIARTHELPPHRRTVPSASVRSGIHQLRLALTVSAEGQVLNVQPDENASESALWPAVRSEVLAWRFMPFESNGKAVTAQVNEYVSVVPPERLPLRRVAPPILRATSTVAITLQRSACFGDCPAYTVSIEPPKIIFEGLSHVVAPGVHTGSVRPEEVRRLAKKFIDADFYSMEDAYRWPATDLPTYFLSITIDGHLKNVTDYMGIAVGMPAVMQELEAEVDRVAGTERWVGGADGLVEQLRNEKFAFTGSAAQIILQEATMRGKTATVRELLAAGVPLTPLPRLNHPNPFLQVGWLKAASSHPDILKMFVNAGASRNDQADKDGALFGAARSGRLESVKALIAYGANPNTDLRWLLSASPVRGLSREGLEPGIILIAAATSGNPDVVKEILRYHPNLEARNQEGKTPLFAAVVGRTTDLEGARLETVRLLAAAGADVNARDKDGNTPLHRSFLPEVVTELLKRGADVNAKNAKGETPIFTTPNDRSIPLLLQGGADLSIRDLAGKTVIEAAQRKGSSRQAALAKAIGKDGRH